MTATISTLFYAALELPDEARLQLVEKLIPTIQSESDLEKEHVTEVQRRMDEVRLGKVQTIPGEQVFRDIALSLKERRKA